MRAASTSSRAHSPAPRPPRRRLLGRANDARPGPASDAARPGRGAGPRLRGCGGGGSTRGVQLRADRPRRAGALGSRCGRRRSLRPPGARPDQHRRHELPLPLAVGRGVHRARRGPRRALPPGFGQGGPGGRARLAIPRRRQLLHRAGQFPRGQRGPLQGRERQADGPRRPRGGTHLRRQGGGAGGCLDELRVVALVETCSRSTSQAGSSSQSRTPLSAKPAGSGSGSRRTASPDSTTCASPRSTRAGDSSRLGPVLALAGLVLLAGCGRRAAAEEGGGDRAGKVPVIVYSSVDDVFVAPSRNASRRRAASRSASCRTPRRPRAPGS